MIKFYIDEIEIVSLPQMRVVFFKDFSHEPEMKTKEMVNKWLEKHGLEENKDGIKIFGFDCDEFPTNRPDGKHAYGMFVFIPDNILLNINEENIRIFKGGKYARLIISDPFSGDFPDGWNKLIEWTVKNGYKNKNVSKTRGR
jgi:effector-binding domain-containing protein